MDILSELEKELGNATLNEITSQIGQKKLLEAVEIIGLPKVRKLAKVIGHEDLPRLAELAATLEGSERITRLSETLGKWKLMQVTMQLGLPTLVKLGEVF